MKKDVRIIVQNIQRYDDYTDKIVTNAIGNYSRSGSSHSVLYRELCAGGHVVENRLIINPEKANLYRTGSIFTEMSFINEASFHGIAANKIHLDYGFVVPKNEPSFAYLFLSYHGLGLS